MENGLQVKPGLIDFDGGVDILAPAGSVMIFHALLVHNSRPNTSGRPRRIMIYSHYPDRVDMGQEGTAGHVTSQSPQAGATAPQGSTVTIVVTPGE